LLNLWIVNDFSHSDKGYSVRDVYQLMTTQDSNYGCDRRSHLAYSSSLEGLYFCVVSYSRQVTNNSKPGFLRHFIIRNSSLRVWMRIGRIGPTFIPLLRHFWFSVASGSLLDWLFFDGRSYSFRPLRPIYLFNGWSKCVYVTTTS
jgi:hypothetical protein